MGEPIDVIILAEGEDIPERIFKEDMTRRPTVAIYGRCPKDGSPLIMTHSVILCPVCRDKRTELVQSKVLRDIGGSG